MPSPEDLQHRYKAILQQPTERMNVELKGWFEIGTPEGMAKILKGCLALRNTDGGYFIVGVEEVTGRVVQAPWADPFAHFPPDDIQRLLAEFSSIPFSVEVHHLTQDGLPVVLIDVPGGITSPVITRKQLLDPKNNPKALVEAHVLYCRTIGANRTYSSARALHSDFGRVVDICWRNREMDIASFVKRHWLDLNTAVSGLPSGRLDKLDKFISLGLERFQEHLTEMGVSSSPMPGMFTFGFCWDKEIVSGLDMRSFRNKVLTSAPDMTGWPFWLDPASQGVQGLIVKDTRWEGFLGWHQEFEGVERFNMLSFFMFAPQGLFFHHRAFIDDLIFGFRPRPDGWVPGSIFTMDQALFEVAEALVGAKIITQALWEGDPVSMPSSVHVRMTWSGLKGRVLRREVHPFRVLWHEEIQTATEQITRVVELPLDAPKDVITDLVHKVTENLFQQFGGFQINLPDVTRILDEGWKRV